MGAVGDITERKETERALRESEARHALAMQAINEAVYEWDIATSEMYYSPRLHKMFGLPPEQLRTRADLGSTGYTLTTCRPIRPPWLPI